MVKGPSEFTSLVTAAVWSRFHLSSGFRKEQSVDQGKEIELNELKENYKTQCAINNLLYFVLYEREQRKRHVIIIKNDMWLLMKIRELDWVLGHRFT